MDEALLDRAPGTGAAAAVGAIFARAAQRARAEELPYAGAVTPLEAWALQSAGAATIVDVRTRAEWKFVGRVPGVPLVEWQRLDEAGLNPGFLEQLAEVVGRGEAVLFLCRSAVRSDLAAEHAAQAGYERAYNVLEGFEGDLDADQRRGTRGGWRHAGLPWIQS